jgi:hypothetical protein
MAEYKFKLRKSLLYSAKSPDLSSEVRSLKAAKAGCMLFASYTSDAILMVKTLKTQKASPKSSGARTPVSTSPSSAAPWAKTSKAS